MQTSLDDAVVMGWVYRGDLALLFATDSCSDLRASCLDRGESVWVLACSRETVSERCEKGLPHDSRGLSRAVQ